MATKSILKNIDIKSRTMGYAIVSSLEDSKNKESEVVKLQYNCEELNGDEIKQIFNF